MTQAACSDNDSKIDTAQGAATIPNDAGPDAGPDAEPDAGTPLDVDYDGGAVPIYAAAPTSDDGTRLVSRPSHGSRSTKS